MGVVIIDVFTAKSVSLIFYILLIIGAISFIMYDAATYKIMRTSDTLKFDDIKFWSVVKVLAYEFFYYRFRMIMIILYASVEYFFKPGGWNKVNRIGTIKNEEE